MAFLMPNPKVIVIEFPIGWKAGILTLEKGNTVEHLVKRRMGEGFHNKEMNGIFKRVFGDSGEIIPFGSEERMKTARRLREEKNGAEKLALKNKAYILRCFY